MSSYDEFLKLLLAQAERYIANATTPKTDRKLKEKMLRAYLSAAKWAFNTLKREPIKPIEVAVAQVKDKK